jgi:hypothetical protein
MTSKKQVINAFHPDYVKTYNPEFVEYFRTLTIQKQCGEAASRHITKKRKTVPSHGTIFGLGEK